MRRITLRDGTPVALRPIRPTDAPQLDAGLERLSPETRYQRFLGVVTGFTPAQLQYLTEVDGIDHLAWVMAIAAAEPSTGIGVARCVRDRSDPELAEVAIVVCDAWQRRGAGSALLRTLAERAWEVGIRRWNGLMLAGNEGGRRVLGAVGTLRSERHQGHGVVEVTYDLQPSLFTRRPSVLQQAASASRV